ncbi:hypothetical protein VTO58DRAFT_110440 [Aureobasidium pullulans]
MHKQIVSSRSDPETRAAFALPSSEFPHLKLQSQEQHYKSSKASQKLLLLSSYLSTIHGDCKISATILTELLIETSTGSHPH